MKKLGLCIKKLRQDLGLSQKKIANLSGITQGYFSKIEQGQKTPTLDNIEKIAEALSIPVSLILYMAEADKFKKKNDFFELMDKNINVLSSYIISSKKQSLSKTSFMQKANKLEDEFDSILNEIEKIKLTDKEIVVS